MNKEAKEERKRRGKRVKRGEGRGVRKERGGELEGEGSR